LKLYLGRFDEEKAFAAWNKSLIKKGSGADEVFDELRKAGFVSEDEMLSPSRVIEFVRNLPSKKDIPVVRPPEPFNIDEEFNKIVSPKEKIVEAPFVVPKSVAEKTALQTLLQKEKTAAESMKDAAIAGLPVDQKIEYQTLKGMIDNSPLSPEDKISVSRFYDNLYLIDKVDPRDEEQFFKVLQAIKPQAKVWLEQIKTIATYDLGNADEKIRGIAKVLEGLKGWLTKRSVLSTQDKLTSVKFGKPSAFLQFLYMSVNPFRFLSSKTRDAVLDLIPKEEREIFAQAFEEGKLETLSSSSQKAARIWKEFSDMALDIVNELRIELGKNPIPKVDRYFPRQLTEVLTEAINDAVKKDTLFVGEGTDHFLKRSLQSLGALHSKNPDIALTSYMDQLSYHIDYLLKEIINRETRHWDEELRERLLQGLRSTSPTLTGKEMDLFVADLAEKPAKVLENALNKAGIKHTIEKVYVTPELREAILASPDLANNSAVKALLEKGYWELRAFDREAVYKAIREGLTLPALGKLALNASFTVVNTTQPMVEGFKTLGATSALSIAKGYTKGYGLSLLKYPIKFIAPEAEIVKDIEQTASLGRILGIIEAKWGVMGEAINLLDKLPVLGKGLTANLKLTELGNRLTSNFAFLDRVMKKIPNLTPEEARILGANYSAMVNFVGGRYMSPQIKKGIIGSAGWVFMQFPVSDSMITLANIENILSKDKVLSEVYKSIFLSIGDKELMDKVVADIDKLTPGQLDSLFGLTAAALGLFSGLVAVLNSFNIIHAITNKTEPYISTKRAKDEALQAVVPGLSVIQRFQTGGTPTYASTPRTDISLPLHTPPIDTAVSIGNMLKGLAIFADGLFTGDIQKADDGYDYFWLSAYQAAPTFTQRIQDWYDLITTGYIPKREIGSEKIQYKLKGGESPLTVLFFGRGTTAGYSELEKAREEELRLKSLNEEAARAFMSALEEQDPIKKQQKLEIYKKLVLEKGAAPITKQGLRQRLLRRQLDAAQRRLQTLPKVQRYRILQQLYGNIGE